MRQRKLCAGSELIENKKCSFEEVNQEKIISSNTGGDPFTENVSLSVIT